MLWKEIKSGCSNLPAIVFIVVPQLLQRHLIPKKALSDLRFKKNLDSGGESIDTANKKL